MSFTASLDQIVHENRNGLLNSYSSWERVPLGEVCSILNGSPFPSEFFNGKEGVPLIRIRDVLRGETETFYNGPYDREFLICAGDLLVGMDGDFNCSLWRGLSGLLNQRVCKLTPREEFYSKRLLAFVLPGYLAAINAETSSITVKHLSSQTIRDIPLPLPPRAEQDRLAVFLEEKLTDLDAAVAALERVRANLKRYRASVLKSAVEGRLLPTEAELARKEGRDFERASVLLERILAERHLRWEESELARMKAIGKTPNDGRWKLKYKEPVAPDTATPPELPDGWCWASLDQLNSGSRSSAYGVLQPGSDLDEGVPLVRVGDIKDGLVETENLKRIDPTISATYRRTILQGGELLMSLVGSIGRTAVAPQALAGSNTARAVGVVPLERLVNAHWVETWFRNPDKIAEMTGKAHEVARKTLNLEDVRTALVALPPAAEQLRITAEVQLRESVAREVEHLIEANGIRCDRLRQAILKWAFEGKLVDQEPNDEPASVLIERIRAERASAVPSTNSRKPGLHVTEAAK
jgi:type I restriction enzyme S subunit